MKVNKRIIIAIPLIAIVVFIGLYFIYRYSEPNILSSSNKKWVTENNGKIYDIAVTNDIPVYSDNGTGIIFDFLDYVTEQSTINFNKIPYMKDSLPSDVNYKIEIIDGSLSLSNKQLLIYEDNYVLIAKKDMKINDTRDIAGMTIGTLKSDTSNVTYYLNKNNNIKHFSYGTSSSIFKALDDNEVNAIVVPGIMYMDEIIQNRDNYYVNYHFTEIVKNVVLTMSDSYDELNSIFVKCYNKWFSDNYNSEYNSLLLDYYIGKNNINAKTKADLLSKTYIYGYVENPPYEVTIGNHLEGIAIEYLNRIIRLADIDIMYKKYASIEDLNYAISNSEVDIYLDYINNTNEKYLKTKSVFIEKYAVLGQMKDGYIINSIESLKGKDINMLGNSYIYNYMKNNSMANIKTYNSLELLLKESDGLLVVDQELYDYYQHKNLSKYQLLYTDIMPSDYSFMVHSENISFYQLFNYIINTNSYYNYRNTAYANLNTSIFDKVSFEELYLIILAIILVPIIILISVILIIKNKRKLKLVKKEDRKKYTDMLTSLKNRNYLNLNIDSWNNSRVYPQSIIIIDLNNTKYVNDNYGREKGDLLIVRAASFLVNAQLENSEIIRSDGNEFLIYMVGYNENQVETYTKKLSKTLKDLPYGFGAAIGYSMIIDNIKTIDDAINEATIEMQSDKESYK